MAEGGIKEESDSQENERGDARIQGGVEQLAHGKNAKALFFMVGKEFLHINNPKEEQ